MKIFEKDELKLLWPYYLEYFIASLFYFMPVFLVVYFSSLNLTAFQMGILLAVWPLSSLIFEIPTGAFADLYGRKMSVLVGYALEGLVMILLFFGKSYTLMLIAFALFGFAVTFSSGSKDAWIVDLINKNNKKYIHGFFSKLQFFIGIGLVLSGILGAFLVKIYGLSIIFLAAAFSYLLSITILYFYTTEIFQKKEIKNSFMELKKQAKQSLNYGYNHYILFYFLIAGIIAVFALNLQSNISWIPLLKDLGMKDYQFGYLWSLIGIITAFAPIIALKFIKKGNERKVIIFGLILWALITALILFANSLVFALLILSLGLFFYFTKFSSEETFFHSFVQSKMRASLGSIRNMLLSIATIISLPVAGFLIDSIGARYTIFISAIVMIPAILIYFKMKDRQPKSLNSNHY